MVLGRSFFKGRRQTAGELALKASLDETKYDPLEVGHAVTDDTYKQLLECGQAHEEVFDEPEYFIVRLVATDCLIRNARRHKYYGWLWLPDPRPQQSCFLYKKGSPIIKRIWSLPDAKVMAIISEMPRVAKQWELTKFWCDAFFARKFHERIRDQYKITHLSQAEFISAHRKKGVEPSSDDISSADSNSFDFSKFLAPEVVNPEDAFSK